jgi:MFS family permease
MAAPDRAGAVSPQAAQPSALLAAFLRPASAAAGLGPGGYSLGLVEHLLRLESGLGAETGGAIASVGTAWIFLVPLWGRVGRRYGLRRLLVAGYGIAGVMTMATAVAFHLPLGGCGDARAGWIWCRNDRRRRQAAVPAHGPSL